MANEQNLIPNEKRTPSERRENARKAGIASGEARRRKRMLKDALDELLEREYSDKNGNVMDGNAVIAWQLFKEARDGNVRAFEALRDTVGQKPVERVETVEISAAAREEMDRLLGLDG